jgi:hypothetical protein
MAIGKNAVLNVKITNNMRISEGLIPKDSAIPPSTPASIRFLRERVNLISYHPSYLNNTNGLFFLLQWSRFWYLHAA